MFRLSCLVTTEHSVLSFSVILLKDVHKSINVFRSKENNNNHVWFRLERDPPGGGREEGGLEASGAARPQTESVYTYWQMIVVIYPLGYL